MKNKKIFLFFSFIFLAVFLFSVKFVLAGNILGVEEVDSSIVLKATDPRTIAAQIINVLLGLLAIMAVSLVIYGGFVWMTSEGNEEKVSQAKRILKNGVIGLIIILAAWGIVTFIFRSLFPDNQSGSSGITPGQVFFQQGLGAIGACSLESVYPEPRQKNVPRNTMIMATFKEEVASTTVNSDNVIICPEDSFDAVSMDCSQPERFSFSTNDNKIFVFIPENHLGNENSATNYIVYFSSNILIKDGSRSIFGNCSNSYFLWDFEVSNVLDLTPPKISSIFPQPDNFKDTSTTINAVSATGSFTVLDVPNYYQPATISTTNGSVTNATAAGTINPNYNGAYTDFNVVIAAGDKALLSSGGNQLGAFDVVNKKSVSFTNYFSLSFSEDVSAGNSWDITVIKMIPADTISVGEYVYTFVNSTTTGFYIKVDNITSNDYAELATRIKQALNSNPYINIENNGNTAIVSMSAKVAGSGGNGITLASSNTNKISFQPFSGGINSAETITVNDKKDKPMNSIIQINFNEAINPLMVSGDSTEVSNTIKIVNSNSNTKFNGDSCSKNSDCASWNCTSGQCVGNFLSGKFQISSNYKTVEFKSDQLCGVNACGEDIYCLPPDSHLRVNIIAPLLFDCGGNNNLCSNKSPFSTCESHSINNSSYYICTNSDDKFYPLSRATATSGVMDAAANSFDGNGNGYSEGPKSFYYKNTPTDNGDNFNWSFWINNKIETDPPQINLISPTIGATSTDLWLPIKIGFNKLMMASTLRTGELTMSGKSGNIQHRLINLFSGQLVGYWIGSENVDTSPLDGEPDETNAYINHAQFYEGAGYSAQVGSGVKDIYQNCFKPSVGLSCSATASAPYCCDGVATSSPCN